MKHLPPKPAALRARFLALRAACQTPSGMVRSMIRADLVLATMLVPTLFVYLLIGLVPEKVFLGVLVLGFVVFAVDYMFSDSRGPLAPSWSTKPTRPAPAGEQLDDAR